jgi:hypothetical protein
MNQPPRPLPSMNSSIKTSGWIAMAAERAWGIRMKNEEERVCKSAEPSRGSEKSSTMEGYPYGLVTTIIASQRLPGR